MTKFERKKKRKEMRRAQADQEREEKANKEKKVEKKARPANYRRDSEGSIILFGAVKISKMSWIVLGIIGLVGIYLAVGFHYGEGDVVEPMISFEECEAIDFNDSLCSLEYKFCRTYADGKTICQYAQEDPFVNVDEGMNFYAPEEQDFLPPTDFILPLVQWAEARGDDEPTCYTSYCKTMHPEQDKSKEQTIKELNRSVIDLRKDISIIEDRLITAERKVMEWTMDEPVYRQKVTSTEHKLEDAEEEFEYKKTMYRHAMDVKPRNDEDINMQDIAKKEYDNASRQLTNAQKDYNVAQKQYDDAYDEYLEAQDDVHDLKDELDFLLDELALARIDANLIHRENKFISIILSESCKRMIEYEIPTECPTYRELEAMFDNTFPNVSGGFVDKGYDIERENPKYSNHWNYYKQLEHWKIITVDPDVGMMRQSAVIEIQPNSFTYLENIKNTDKSRSYNSTGYERYVWSDIKYTDRCTKAIVAPDMDLVGQAINHFLKKCQDDVNNKETFSVEKSFFDMRESAGWQYVQWVEDAKKQCKEKCN
jgi:hypothetical protein